MPGNGIPAWSRTLLRAPSQPTRYRAVTWYGPSGPRTSAVTVASSWLTPATSCPRRMLGAEFAGAFVEQALESRLRERHRPHRGIGQM